MAEIQTIADGAGRPTDTPNEHGVFFKFAIRKLVAACSAAGSCRRWLCCGCAAQAKRANSSKRSRHHSRSASTAAEIVCGYFAGAGDEVVVGSDGALRLADAASATVECDAEVLVVAMLCDERCGSPRLLSTAANFDSGRLRTARRPSCQQVCPKHRVWSEQSVGRVVGALRHRAIHRHRKHPPTRTVP